MEKWEPLLWIFGSGVAFFLFLMLLESIKVFKKKKG
jgi:hypothetical protein